MAKNISEILKGVLAFLLGSVFFYFAWEVPISPLIQALTETSVYMGAIAWISFIGVWLFACPIYLMYTIVVGSRSENSTDLLCIWKGVGMWILFLGIILIIHALFFGIGNFTGVITTLVGIEISGQGWDNSETLTVINQLGSLGVVLLILLVTMVPFYYILKGYGLVDS